MELTIRIDAPKQAIRRLCLFVGLPAAFIAVTAAIAHATLTPDPTVWAQKDKTVSAASLSANLTDLDSRVTLLSGGGVLKAPVDGSISTGGSFVDIGTLSFTAPGPGAIWVVATGVATVGVGGTVGVGVSTYANNSKPDGQIINNTVAESKTFASSLAAHGVFAVTGGINTVYVSGFANTSSKLENVEVVVLFAPSLLK